MRRPRPTHRSLRSPACILATDRVMKPISRLSSLEDSELVLEEVFRHTPIGMMLTDLHRSILDVNEALCSMLGYSRLELVGRSVFDLLDPVDHEDAAAQTRDLISGQIGNYQAIRRYRARGGATVHVKVSASIVYSKDREAVCGLAFVENISDRVEMENALRRSEARYRRIVEDQTEMIVRCRPDGTRTFVNEAYCRYNNTTAADLLDTSFFTCMAPGERELVRRKFASLSPSNPVITDQHWVVGPAGTPRWHEWTDRGFFDDDGNLLEIQSVGRDLTEEHEATERVARSEERHRRLFNSLPVASWESDWSRLIEHLAQLGIDSAEKLQTAIRESPSLFAEGSARVDIVRVNPAALEMAGVATLEQFQSWLSAALSRESAQKYARAIPQLIFGERQSLTDELTLVRTNGERVDVDFRVARSERWGDEWMAFPIAVDVTDRKRIERELVQKQELTERAEAASHFGSWEWDPASNSIYGSPEFWRILEGRDSGGPRQRPLRDCLELLVAEDAAATEILWNALRAPSSEVRPAVIDNHYRMKRPDGTEVVARGQTFPTFAADGTMIRAFGILRDITDAARAEQEAARHRDELLRADKMISLGILVSGMAHEINNPNHTIMLNMPLVREAWRDVSVLIDELAVARQDLRIARVPWNETRGEVAAMLEDVEQASERIRTIVSELRGFALDHDSGVRRTASVNAIVQSSLRLLRKHVSKATKNFSLELDDRVPSVTANASRIEQVVVNLVINACQALMNDKQAIRIRTGVAANRVFIQVRDEGRGISAEHLQNIRNPFFTTRRAEGGTGLGLAVSDRIAAEHSGELTFESEIGRGTTATLWLPAGAP